MLKGHWFTNGIFAATLVGSLLISCVCVCGRVDDLYAFFVQWSPDVYGKEAREQGFVVVEKDELDMIDNFFSDPASCSWEVCSGLQLTSPHLFSFSS